MPKSSRRGKDLVENGALIGRPPPWSYALAAAMLAAVLLAAAVPAGAASKKEEEARRHLLEAEQRKAQQAELGKEAAERAARAAGDTARLGRQRAQAAAKLQEAEAALQAVATRIDALAGRRRDAERQLAERAEALRPLLPLIERLSLYPMETLLALPDDPEDALRGLLVLKGLARRIETDAQALKRDQAELDAATTALHAEQPKLAEAQALQKREAAALDAQINAAHAAQDKAEAEAQSASTGAAKAAAQADSLKAALAALEAEERAAAARAREEAERADRQKRVAEAQAARQRAASAAAPSGPTASMSAGSARLQPPVIGVVVRSWGQPTDSGPATGISYQAPPGARVISPCGGRVVFADTFRSYGLLMIVDCGGGFHVVLAGFERLDVRLGQSVVAAEPVGVMPGWEPGSNERRPALYVELRHAGQPVNPAPLMRSSG